MTKKHAKLSASGSGMWLNCPGSIKAQEGFVDKSSSFAEEGTLAHEIADLCLKNEYEASHYVGMTLEELKIDLSTIAPSEQISREMCNYVQEYLDYVLSHETENSILYTEERVNFSNVVPGGFGTLDAAVLDYNKELLHIFDLKYGKGVSVDAFENTQGQMYAIGMLNEIGFLEEFTDIRIHIVQPRLNNYSYWDISVEDLTKFSHWVAERAQLALSDNAPRIPGEKQCQWCKAKHNCKALKEFTEDIIMNDFDEMDDSNMDEHSITDIQRKRILDNRKLIESFFKSVEDSVFLRLQRGESFKGYKLVTGRSNRIWKEDAESTLVKELGDGAYTKKLITITAAQKELGKDVVNELAIKPEGKPTLAPESDKRQAIIISSIEDELNKD